MSGNPFRRKTPPQPQSILTNARHNTESPDRFGDVQDQNRRPSVNKQVRIVTPPPLSPDDPLTPVSSDSAIQKVADETHAGSPPPSPTIAPSAQDSILERRIADDVASLPAEVLENTRRNSATDSAMPPMPTSRAPPINPFAKTLATMQPSAVDQFEQKFPALPGESAPGETRAQQNPGKPQMDVNSFADLLMAGIKPRNPTASRTASTSSANAVSVNDGTSTETSSISKHSLSEKETETSADSIHSAYDDYETDSDDPSRTQSNRSTLKSKPPPPARRHGKTVASRTPETVSFDDFAANMVTPATSKARTADEGRVTDANKPLPPAPVPRKPDAGRDAAATAAETAARTAPAPPLARRASSRTAQPPPSSLSVTANSSTAQQQTPINAASTTATTTKTSRPPPPPPTRRGGAAPRPGQTLETASNMSDAGSIEYPAQEGGSSRPSSITSRNSLVQTQPPPPPPPPPPRRRGSSKGSVEAPSPPQMARRTSGERGRNSMDSVTKASGALASKLSEVEEEAKVNPTRDVLAEMEALQAEIDALRARAGDSAG